MGKGVKGLGPCRGTSDRFDLIEQISTKRQSTFAKLIMGFCVEIADFKGYPKQTSSLAGRSLRDVQEEQILLS